MKNITREVQSDSINTISINVADDTQEFEVKYLLDWMMGEIAQGVEFKNDQTIQFGFSLLLCKIQDSQLSLMGPDYSQTPFQWTNNLTPAVRLFLQQKFCTESFSGISLTAALLSQTAIVGRGFESDPFIMRRHAPSEQNERDSGWFVGSLREDIDNNDPANLKLASLFDVIVKQPKSFEFLLFPVETIVAFMDGGAPRVILGDAEIQAGADSYFARKYRTQPPQA